MSNINTVVWDADNTLWSWMDFAVPAYEAMTRDLARISGKSVDETQKALQRYYSGVHSIENEGVVQKLNADGFFAGIKDFDETQAIIEVQAGFEAARAQHFHVYDGIFDVMSEIRNQGIRQIVLTDAPGNQALSRLIRSRLFQFIEEVIAMPTADINVPAEIRDRSLMKRRELKIPELRTVNKEKPETPLEEVVRLTRAQIIDQVAIIGDNAGKDMALAEIYQCLGIHAVYGSTTPEAIESIRRVAPPQTSRRNVQNEPFIKAPDNSQRIFPANTPAEILEILFGDRTTRV